ncbi:MAG: hypothetical protein ACAH12_01705 [Methylophilaceae bacterium]
MRFNKILAITVLAYSAFILNLQLAHAQVLPDAVLSIKIPLISAPTSRPMTVAYIEQYQRYYVADGGLGPVPGSDEQTSKSQMHVYDVNGAHIQTASPGFNNRSLYYNPNSRQLETITYNISSAAGFAPNTGLFSIDTDEKGNLLQSSKDISGPNPAFGGAATMPTYDAANNLYYAKQERSSVVRVVDLKSREKVAEIKVDIESAGAKYDDISDHFIAYTGILGEELALLDVDHRAILVFDIKGKFVGKSALPADLKLFSKNHYNGLGYANGMMFVYYDRLGEFGTYYGFRFSDQIK